MVTSAFPPFPTMFSNGFFLRVIKTHDCVVKKSTSFIQQLTHDYTIQTFNASGIENFENMVGKGENAGN